MHWKLLLCCVLAKATLFAQLSPSAASIPTRDAKLLAGDVYLPDTVGSYPVILIQTPYNKANFQLGLPLGVGTNISSSDYAFVVVDWRCFYGSAAACVAQPNRGEDGYDVIEWISQQSWCDGNVGTWGPSALGNIQWLTAFEQHPNHKCAVPEVASPQTSFEGYYPGGALITSHLATLSVLYGQALLNQVVANQVHNFLWGIVEAGYTPQNVNIPMLLVAGWYDHNTKDNFKNLDELRNLSDPAVRDDHKILVGPWVHGGTGIAYVGSSVQGELNYPLAAGYNQTYERQFFDYYLRGQNNGWMSNPRYRYYQMGEGMWLSTSDWPPSPNTTQTLYFHSDGSIQDTMPTLSMANLSYAYDPTDPSPTVGGKTLDPALDQGPYDQAPVVESRGDNLIFTTPTLTTDMVIQGKVKVNLYFSSDRVDTDVVLRITDVYPDGRSMLLESTIQRMRYLNGNTSADTGAITPGTVYPVTLEFDPMGITLPAGHRLRIVLTSSNYPMFNRNMNTGGQMYPNGNIDTLVNPLVATNSVELNSTYPSSIEIPMGPQNLTIAEADSPAMRIWPNPAKETAHVWMDGPAELKVLDASGRLILTQAMHQGQNEIHTTDWEAGVYFLTALNSEGERLNQGRCWLGVKGSGILVKLSVNP